MTSVELQDRKSKDPDNDIRPLKEKSPESHLESPSKETTLVEDFTLEIMQSMRSNFSRDLDNIKDGDEEKEEKRWDLWFLQYFCGLWFVAIAFGLAQVNVANYMMLFAGTVHFATELTITAHLFLPKYCFTQKHLNQRMSP